MLNLNIIRYSTPKGNNLKQLIIANKMQKKEHILKKKKNSAKKKKRRTGCQCSDAFLNHPGIIPLSDQRRAEKARQ